MDILKRDLDRDRRGRQVKDGLRGQGPVVCLLTRDLRMQDNWTLLWAQQEAVLHQKALLVVLCCGGDSADLSRRQAAFMHGGVQTTQKNWRPSKSLYSCFQRGRMKRCLLFCITLMRICWSVISIRSKSNADGEKRYIARCSSRFMRWIATMLSQSGLLLIKENGQHIHSDLKLIGCWMIISPISHHLKHIRFHGVREKRLIN